MSHQDEFKRTIRYGDAAFSQLKRNEVPAYPKHYELWYAYSVGYNHLLNQSINEILRARGRITLDEVSEVYNRFMAPNRLGERVDEVGQGITSEIDAVAAAVERSINAATDYSSTLNGATQQLGATQDPSRIQAIVGELLIKTKETDAINRSLEQQLDESRRQIDELKENLDAIRFESLTDELTTLANRKHFDQSMDRYLRDAEAGRQGFALLMTDIDHFKRFNDNYGHQTGDQVLRLVGLAVKQNVKAQDVPCRYGGEEFGIILPGTSLDEAIEVAERIRISVMSKELVKRSTGENLGHITISIGVAHYRAADSVLTMIERADEAMYLAKNIGRNRVCSEQELDAAGGHAVKQAG